MFVWVILHYMVLDMTVNEVNHILRQVKGRKKIIIVDNCSPNGSGNKLKELYKDNDVVEVVLTDKNIGFAKGNNIGYIKAKNYNPDFIVFSNNDIKILQDDFQERVRAVYSEKQFAVLGPDIYVPSTQQHQNPKKKKSYTPNEVNDQIEKNKKILNSTVFTRIRVSLKQSSFLRKLVLNLRKRETNRYIPPSDSCVLHGSFLVVSKLFINSFPEWAFYPKTFFYYEMEIMDLFLKEKGLLSCYVPSLKIVHMQNTSTKATYKKAIDQQKFQSNQMVESGRVFLEVYDSLRKNSSRGES